VASVSGTCAKKQSVRFQRSHAANAALFSTLGAHCHTRSLIGRLNATLLLMSQVFKISPSIIQDKSKLAVGFIIRFHASSI